MASNQPKKTKKGHVDGWCAATIDTLLKNRNKNKAMRTGAVTLIHEFMNLHHQIAKTKWTNIHSRKMFTFKAPVLMIIDSFKSGS